MQTFLQLHTLMHEIRITPRGKTTHTHAQMPPVHREREVTGDEIDSNFIKRGSAARDGVSV